MIYIFQFLTLSLLLPSLRMIEQTIPDSPNRGEGSVGFECVRYLSIEFKLWEYHCFGCTVICGAVHLWHESLRGHLLCASAKSLGIESCKIIIEGNFFPLLYLCGPPVAFRKLSLDWTEKKSLYFLVFTICLGSKFACEHDGIYIYWFWFSYSGADFENMTSRLCTHISV